mgnify:FL=1
MQEFDLAIIGGGPAGYTAAEAAQKGGMRVVLFERDYLGGVCLNVGCIPTKTLLYGAKMYHQAVNASKYGVKAETVAFDYEKMQQRKQKVVRKLTAGIRSRLQGVEIVQGEAVVKSCAGEDVIIEVAAPAATGISPQTGTPAKVPMSSTSLQTYSAKNLLICTGSSNVVPPIPGVTDNPQVWSSTDALAAKELPESIVIVGGGVIGMEFATLYSELGVEVTVVEYMPQILPSVDEEIAAMLRSNYEKRGVRFLTGAKVVAVDGGTVKVERTSLGECAASGTAEERESCKTIEDIKAERVLISVGRRPNLRGLEALEELEYEGRGIRVNEFMQTNLRNVYAAGDVTGKIMLAHVASRQAEVAVGRMLKQIPLQRIAYNAIPSVVYTNPEIASVGLSERDVHSKANVGSHTGDDCVLPMDVEVKKIPMTFSGRFVAENEGETGLCKMIVDKRSQSILGVHLYGNPASEFIGAASAAVRFGYTLAEWRQVVFPHPTVSEVLKEVL